MRQQIKAYIKWEWDPLGFQVMFFLSDYRTFKRIVLSAHIVRALCMCKSRSRRAKAWNEFVPGTSLCAQHQTALLSNGH